MTPFDAQIETLHSLRSMLLVSESSTLALRLQAAAQTLVATRTLYYAATQVYDHWGEFGPAYGMEEVMARLKGHLDQMGTVLHGTPSIDAEIIARMTHPLDLDVARVFQDFWAPLVCPDGTWDLGQVKRELYDYHAMIAEVTKVYDTLTCGRFTKPNTAAEHILSEVEERTQEAIRDALADRQAE